MGSCLFHSVYKIYFSFHSLCFTLSMFLISIINYFPFISSSPNNLLCNLQKSFLLHFKTIIMFEKFYNFTARKTSSNHFALSTIAFHQRVWHWINASHISARTAQSSVFSLDWFQTTLHDLIEGNIFPTLYPLYYRHHFVSITNFPTSSID